MKVQQFRTVCCVDSRIEMNASLVRAAKESTIHAEPSTFDVDILVESRSRESQSVHGLTRYRVTNVM